MSERKPAADKLPSKSVKTADQVLHENAVESMYKTYARFLCDYDEQPDVASLELTTDGAVVVFANGKRVEMSKFV